MAEFPKELIPTLEFSNYKYVFLTPLIDTYHSMLSNNCVIPTDLKLLMDDKDLLVYQNISIEYDPSLTLTDYHRWLRVRRFKKVEWNDFPAKPGRESDFRIYSENKYIALLVEDTSYGHGVQFIENGNTGERFYTPLQYTQLRNACLKYGSIVKINDAFITRTYIRIPAPGCYSMLFSADDLELTDVQIFLYNAFREQHTRDLLQGYAYDSKVVLSDALVLSGGGESTTYSEYNNGAGRPLLFRYICISVGYILARIIDWRKGIVTTRPGSCDVCAFNCAHAFIEIDRCYCARNLRHAFLNKKYMAARNTVVQIGVEPRFFILEEFYKIWDKNRKDTNWNGIIDELMESQHVIESWRKHK